MCLYFPIYIVVPVPGHCLEDLSHFSFILGIIVFKFLIWGGKSLALWLEISIYGDTSAEPYNTLCNQNCRHKTNFQYSYPNSNACFYIFPFKMLYCIPKSGSVSYLKNQTSANEKRRLNDYVMTLDIQSQIFYVTQSDITLYSQVH